MCRVFSVIQRAPKSHISIAVLSVLPVAVLRQPLRADGAGSACGEEPGAGQQQSRSVGLVPLSPALLMQTGNLLDSFSPDCKTSICPAALAFPHGTDGAGGGRGELTARLQQNSLRRRQELLLPSRAIRSFIQPPVLSRKKRCSQSPEYAVTSSSH